eukprot:TRINITY_DN10047_c0_g1_i1.p1 TRINITY_DN10047_c0_g1~~TRINITY_DN10047_c0_g1_i1.p1  ORF type:complete len:196 (+),score=34.76 TRINITY_DN10047_c0_g1_i1:393-980(+)
MVLAHLGEKRVRFFKDLEEFVELTVGRATIQGLKANQDCVVPNTRRKCSPGFLPSNLAAKLDEALSSPVPVVPATITASRAMKHSGNLTFQKAMAMVSASALRSQAGQAAQKDTIAEVSNSNPASTVSPKPPIRAGRGIGLLVHEEPTSGKDVSIAPTPDSVSKTLVQDVVDLARGRGKVRGSNSKAKMAVTMQA